jgi:hypothetical protein
MATPTIRLPDDKHARLKQLAEHRQISMNKLIEELSTVALAQFDAELRFRARAADIATASYRSTVPATVLSIYRC